MVNIYPVWLKEKNMDFSGVGDQGDKKFLFEVPGVPRTRSLGTI